MLLASGELGKQPEAEKRLLDEAADGCPGATNDGRRAAELSNIRVVVRVRPAKIKQRQAVTCGDQSRWTAATTALHSAFEDMLGPQRRKRTSTAGRDVGHQPGVLMPRHGVRQTGAGKTHTMLGENDGIIRRL